MSTKRIQILDSMIKQAENANTLGGRLPSYFAPASEINELHALVGDTSVQIQISQAIEEITADNLGVYVQDTEPTEAVDGDIWIDSSVDSDYYVPINHVHNDATATTSGFMSAADKVKLDNLALGGGVSGGSNIIVDDVLSSVSTNPVQNKVVNDALSNKADVEHTHSGYAPLNDFEDLKDIVGDEDVGERIMSAINELSLDTKLSGKSDADHTHTTLHGVTEINNTTGNVQVNADTINLFSNKILLKSHPQSDYEAATKMYVDNTVSSTVTSAVSGKADAQHTHNEYVSVSDFNDLKNKVGDEDVKEQIDNALREFSSGKTLAEHLTEEDLVLVSGKHYGNTLPDPGTPGRIFFLKASE